jgi:hypothetical protein
MLGAPNGRPSSSPPPLSPAPRSRRETWAAVTEAAAVAAPAVGFATSKSTESVDRDREMSTSAAKVPSATPKIVLRLNSHRAGRRVREEEEEEAGIACDFLPPPARSSRAA